MPCYRNPREGKNVPRPLPLKIFSRGLCSFFFFFFLTSWSLTTKAMKSKMAAIVLVEKLCSLSRRPAPLPWGCCPTTTDLWLVEDLLGKPVRERERDPIPSEVSKRTVCAAAENSLLFIPNSNYYLATLSKFFRSFVIISNDRMELFQ